MTTLPCAQDLNQLCRSSPEHESDRQKHQPATAKEREPTYTPMQNLGDQVTGGRQSPNQHHVTDLLEKGRRVLVGKAVGTANGTETKSHSRESPTDG